MSTFNPNEFMNTSYKEANETRYTPIPEPEAGDGWNAQVTELKARKVKTKDGDEKAVLDITWNILDDAVKQAVGMDKPTVRQTLWLDFTPDGKSLDFGKGKNVKLGRVRDALGQNKSGKAWKPSDMMGGLAKVATKNTPSEDDPEDVYSNVKKVFPA